ncbi:hypothetical protein CXG81DRAFT_26895 [Caulochytrium protostelioides]|uniref:Cilia- and flagella-associated protein 52 n=1 Tax=Caulochytrium protostelioides TaxID=1555241 RepID=A0A4P9X5J7_9FUNG|nr:hypothetical protein CXG81DRAFT_26895 [Caulochytrium protostelioides]|eukprot:RKP00396.1 hypothetical protein CXG81DRAFT_26895 [Caulochytrium protostelioides]
MAPQTAAAAAVPGVVPLALQKIIGFNGAITDGAAIHPDGQHLACAMGTTVMVTTKKDTHRAQTFLQGHTNTVTCLAFSPSGRYLASGQLTHMGFQADIIVWDFAKRQLLYRLTLHKVRVQSLAFSADESCLASLGGVDDNTLVIWDLATGKAICGVAASKDAAGENYRVVGMNHDAQTFVTAGKFSLRIWRLNLASRTLQPTDVQLGQIKRVFQSLAIAPGDDAIYAGTTTGDVLHVDPKTALFKRSGPPKEKDNLGMGITAVCMTRDGKSLVVGSGTGTVTLFSTQTLAIQGAVKVSGGVTGIMRDADQTLLVSTAFSNLYSVGVAAPKLSEPQLLLSCHNARVTDVAFPKEASNVFATASETDIRIWNLATLGELLRIVVPNVACQCLMFSNDGSSLITGWNDGKIRAFGPQSGRIQYTINDAHKGHVTALASTHHDPRGGFRIVSGGADGVVRVWRINPQSQVLESSLKEHKQPVTCVQVRANDAECVTASADGSCIVWDLQRYVRNQILFASSFFKAVAYIPDESQLLTVGSDGRVAYWEAFDGSTIRELDVSPAGINTLAIVADGAKFVVAGDDKVIRVYSYEEGELVAVGQGHSDPVTMIKASPDGKHLVSVAADGAILIWDGVAA